MRRSVQVAAPLLASAALTLLTACRKPEMQRCVDENNRVVADNLCSNPTSGTPSAVYHPGMGYIPMYRYYYGGGGGYSLGSGAFGGGYSTLSGHSYANSTGTIRGGFGSSFSGGHGGSGE
ncbi:hypothetical protein [Granulicella tundricola]|uniref:Lipoprotein n=1 Tax=Granulicella tundricola (strain ATCC BAA-1859 / DSM 23138 / MP5ACTX9) TaxID=1198114 RepID=E8WVC8_GRATM|nr:hypothetical protein [Granulicella tundricola]ADW67303.1 hypothetical protein AciX9_0229 [Granulicella tundricola MP5ACTX9]